MLSFGSLLGCRSDDLVLGRTGRFSFFPKFRISAHCRKFHTYVVGLTGRGKSKFLQNCLLQDIIAGGGRESALLPARVREQRRPSPSARRVFPHVTYP